MLRKIRLLPFLLRWSWAYYGGFGGMSDEVRLKRLARLKPENGPKQVILTQRAAAHWRLGQTQDAVTLFRLARESELEWGGRKRRDVSEYLVEYCAYCVNLIQHDATADENLEAQFERLKALAVADIVKDDFMPMPCSPTGKVY